MKILLIYPEFPETFWSFTRALKFVSKKSAIPPLGLLTVASMLPDDWEITLIDMNVNHLKKRSLDGVDYVFISAMSVQRQSALDVIEFCDREGVKVVAGGPLFTTSYMDIPGVDHFVLNEAEITLPQFIRDVNNGIPRHLYMSGNWADVTKTPLPDLKLLKTKKYASMSLQYTRGCPFNCDFCDITLLYGRKVRIKKTQQVIQELENIYSMGWRQNVFFVDDNFIGNRQILKNETLPAIAEWMRKKNHPFSFNTQASINIADDDELMRLMVDAGFNKVFVGIETPNEESLAECSKIQNKGRDMVACVKKIQNFGMEVQGGFIVGFDSDPKTIFDDQIRFIQKSGIVTAMVGLLEALKGTDLYKRLENENRLLGEETGDNTDCSINFIPKMDLKELVEGYKRIVSTIYTPKYYYFRIRDFLKEYNPQGSGRNFFRFKPVHILTLFKTTFFLGIIGKERLYYWKLMLWTIFRHPGFFPVATTLAIYGFHHRKVSERYVAG
ncbi:MAG: B12-binding domain-containing radical SAM protein [Spirochaetia bacterium]|jgi:radical SAM superfamily enzyme YgiQ (UPF0313 family)|nr:B12-binding domain-containing radical SAM protein [Spirochaetia bacterium]